MNSKKSLATHHPASHRVFKNFKIPKEYKRLGIDCKFLAKLQNRKARHCNYSRILVAE